MREQAGSLLPASAGTSSAGMTNMGRDDVGKGLESVKAKKLGNGDGFVNERFVMVDDISNDFLFRHPQQI